MKIVQILIKSEVLVDLKNIEIPGIVPNWKMFKSQTAIIETWSCTKNIYIVYFGNLKWPPQHLVWCNTIEYDLEIPQ